MFKLTVLFLLFLSVLLFLFSPTVSADILYTCNPVQNKEKFLNQLLNHPDYSTIKKWGNYKFKVSDCYSYQRPSVNHSEYAIITGFYYTPPEISNYGLSYAVNMDIGFSVPVNGDGILVSSDEQFLTPTYIQKIINTVEIDLRAKEFIQTFGANDPYIDRWSIILRNKDSRFQLGCERCGTGVAFKPNLYNGIRSYSLPLNKSYKEFPEISTSLSAVEKNLKSGCTVDKGSNIAIWISLPPSPREVEVQTVGQRCEAQIEVPGLKIKTVASFHDKLPSREAADTWDKHYTTGIFTPTKTTPTKQPTPASTVKPTKPTQPFTPTPPQASNIFIKIFNWIKIDLLHL